MQTTGPDGDDKQDGERNRGSRLRSWLPRLERSRALVLAGLVTVLASAVGGWAAAGHHASRKAAPAYVAKIIHPEGPGSGVTAVDPSGRNTALTDGAVVPCGTTVVTDGRTRARVELEGGTVVAIDRASRFTYLDPHDITVDSGALVVDSAPGGSLRAKTALASVQITDGRFALTVDERRISVGVIRGDVVLSMAHDEATIHPGEEAELSAGASRPEVTATADLGQRIAFGESFESTADETPPSGVGELRARKPGSKDEIDGAVRLSRHDVKTRIAGAMARTEIDETFVNTTDRELEGVWRFPIPPDASLERLALEVDGRLVEGEFVEEKRAAGIWRGVIQHASPSAPRPVDEIVWVPGPWRDPALLEWQRGGRAELKIFPIPRKGTRRVVLAYTQHVNPQGGVRHYVYPLASRVGAAAIDEASFDVRVLGADPAMEVRARGYDLVPNQDPNGGVSTTELGMTRTAFVPEGDLVVDYGTADRATEASAVAFAAPGDEDAYVAIALRPRLPMRVAEHGRDQVIVVDTGRAMYGERIRRAARMAVELAQQMDRRDRVMVLACDLECRVMPGGWRAPGAALAHDVDAFLAGVTADGATDLVGAVRAAASVPNRAADHDFRLVLLSDGVASAGVRRRSRLAVEVSQALADPRALLVAVPIGDDADVDTLSEVAQGGGGLVVPYGAGKSLGAAALEVLSATYGATLRDVELVLPPGMHELAPAAVPSLRSGGETLVAARMTGTRVSGDVVLRGKLAGEPFEATWPLEVIAAPDPGNAWAARVWAAARIADDERVGDDERRAEAIALSHRFRVPSRLTSLLVLESEAMFRAFSVTRSSPTFSWTGENEARGSETAPAIGLDGSNDKDDGPDDAVGSGALSGALAGRASLGHATPKKANAYDEPAPAATAASPTPDLPRSAASTRGGGGGAGAPAPAASWAPPAEMSNQRARPPRGQWMRREWFRTAAIAADARSPIDEVRLDAARAALAAAPDLRQRHAELAKLLVRSGDIDALEALASRWSSRDPLDPELLTARAAARAWRGDRNEALRILSGMLVAPGVTAERAAELASTLARAEERSSRPGIACALRFAAAESKPDDSSLLAPALACAQLRGDEARWLTASKSDADRGRLSAAVAKLALASRSEENLFGDIVVDATWDNGSGADLDIGVVDPSGKRLSWASTARVRARDCTSRFHEALAVSSSAAGAFVVDIVRSDGGDLGAAPVRGTLRITSQGVTKVVPFVLAGTRAPVARVDVRFESRLVPITAWDDGVPPGWTTPTPTPTSAPRPSLVLRGRDLGT